MSSLSLISRWQTQSSAKSLISDSMSAVMSFMCREINKGPRMVPCGTPDTTGAQSDLTPFTTTRCCQIVSFEQGQGCWDSYKAIYIIRSMILIVNYACLLVYCPLRTYAKIQKFFFCIKKKFGKSKIYTTLTRCENFGEGGFFLIP